MRVLAWIIVAVGSALSIAEASAQTYDPRYPVCQQVWGINGSYIACGYSIDGSMCCDSLRSCRAMFGEPLLRWRWSSISASSDVLGRRPIL
jgi:hypothetical protein